MAVTFFDYHGESYRRITYAQERRFCVGLDLGQSTDPTAIAVVEYHRTPLNDFAVDRDRKVITQRVEEFFDVRHLERLPLSTTYPDISAYVAGVMGRNPLRESGAQLVVDQTGCGRPVCDILRRAGLRFIAVTITGGDVETCVSHDEWRVAKHLLITSLDAKLATKELRFSAKLKEAAVMKAELQDFRRSISATGFVTFNARSGAHDDLIIATALAVYWLGGRKKRGDFAVVPLASIY
jgi:hypothetical protein